MSGFLLPTGRPAVMGVLNVTPDSFSDGGMYLDFTSAIDRAKAMVDEGADLIDVGGESTRPGADPVPVDEELRRVVPIVEALVGLRIPLSVDTSKPRVAQESLEAGAQVINDVTAMKNPGMVGVCSTAKCTVCLMHMQGDPRTMQMAPQYRDVVQEVRLGLVARANQIIGAGIEKKNIWIDPGIGFGKTLQHNLALIRDLQVLVETGYPVLIGVSRKSFLGKILDEPNPEERLVGSVSIQVLAQTKGAKIIRTHDVRATRQAVLVAQSVMG